MLVLELFRFGSRSSNEPGEIGRCWNGEAWSQSMSRCERWGCFLGRLREESRGALVEGIRQTRVEKACSLDMAVL